MPQFLLIISTRPYLSSTLRFCSHATGAALRKLTDFFERAGSRSG